MTTLNPYLGLQGRCREAMTFYQNCLGGELTMQAIADSPLADSVPTEEKQNILHSTLQLDYIQTIYGDHDWHM